MRQILFCLSLLATTSPSLAQNASGQNISGQSISGQSISGQSISGQSALGQSALGLSAPAPVVQSGLLKHILPRFSLKTGVRVVADQNGPMQLNETPPGEPVFQRTGVIYYLRTGEDAGQIRFRDWLLSDIGKRTVESFQPNEGAPFSARFDPVGETRAPTLGGNAALGGELSLTHCGRCHVIGPQNRMSGLGSTPSFAVLRTLSDWDRRFQQFYVLRPHGSFTQIEGVTEPFPANLPPPIHPLRISPADLEAILAFVSRTEPADLGQPLVSQ